MRNLSIETQNFANESLGFGKDPPYMLINVSIGSIKSLKIEISQNHSKLLKFIIEIKDSSSFNSQNDLKNTLSIENSILKKIIEALGELDLGSKEKLLSRWDVAKILFQILGALSILIGIIFTILNYI